MAPAQAREERLEARVTAAQKELFKEAANAKGLSLSDFVVSSATEAAIVVLREKQIIDISRGDQEAFIKALNEAPQVNDRLRTAAKRYGYLPER
jgi:uncharacterized protein (DUF1778 family)